MSKLSAIEMEQIEKVIEQYRKMPLKHFLPSAIAKKVGVSEADILPILEEKCNEGIFQKEFAVICPNYSCIRTVQETDDLSTLHISDELECSVCGEEFELSPEHIETRFKRVK